MVAPTVFSYYTTLASLVVLLTLLLASNAGTADARPLRTRLAPTGKHYYPLLSERHECNGTYGYGSANATGTAGYPRPSASGTGSASAPAGMGFVGQQVNETKTGAGAAPAAGSQGPDMGLIGHQVGGAGYD